MSKGSIPDCLSGENATRLPSGSTCIDGFYCPNNSAQMLPEYCPPTPECRLIRLQEFHNICDQPQGTYEPVACKAGSYCPPGGKHQITCPAKHFCPLGSIRPTPCFVMSVCPEGSSRQIYTFGFLWIILLDILILAVMFGFFDRKKFPWKLGSSTGHNNFPQQDQETMTASGNGQRTLQLCNLCLPNDHSISPIEINFQGISLQVKSSVSEVLSRQSGKIRPGSFLGVMGPSGAGKSTLMNIITGRMSPTTGQIYINGYTASPTDLRHLVGFVPQDDITLPDLTVKENILHSARIQLGNTWSDQEIQRYVISLISSLALYQVRDSLVGDITKRGISGGERKRVNIALELAAGHGVLILDEPTSGLDGKTALSLIQLLKSLTLQGVTIVCVVHQPSAEIFTAFDDLLLLHLGRQIYLGEAAKACQRLIERDQTLPMRSNPADIIIDYISMLDNQGCLDVAESQSAHPAEIPSSRYYTNQDHSPLIQSIRQRKAPWYRQVYFNLLRGMTQQSRQLASFSLEMTSGTVTGLLIGLSNFEFKGHLFQGLFHTPFEYLSAPMSYRLLTEQGMLCCLAIGIAAGPAGVKTFGNEKHIFTRESFSGHSESAYFVGKVLSTFPRIFLSALHFTSFYMVLTASIIPFGVQLSINILYFYCIYGLGCVVAAVTYPQDGPLMTMLVSLIMSALGGCAPRLASVKMWNLQWFWFLWPGLWYSEALFNEATSPLSYLYNIKLAADATGYTTGRTYFDLWMLLLIGVVYHLIAYTLLLLITRNSAR